jgi:hypothetical protein
MNVNRNLVDYMSCTTTEQENDSIRTNDAPAARRHGLEQNYCLICRRAIGTDSGYVCKPCGEQAIILES